MNGNKLLADTNIILYLLSGDVTLSDILQDKTIYISFVTELELLGFKDLSKKEESIISRFIEECTVLDVNSQIKKTVIELRKHYTLKLPDCLVIASSIYMDVPVITADADFKKVEDLDLLFYNI